MKDHGNNDVKKNHGRGSEKFSSTFAGGFFHAASAFGRKLQKWRGKKKGNRAVPGGDGNTERDQGGGNLDHMLARDAQSEFAYCGYPRRSCDNDFLRFSLEGGRLSMDVPPRRSLDNPRASWDGSYTVGGRHPIHRMMMPMMGPLDEDFPGAVVRSDNKIPVEDPANSINEDAGIPGGSLQTREYYLDSSSQRRRRSFEQPRPVRRNSALLIDETMYGSICKVSPAVTDNLHRNRIMDSKAPVSSSNPRCEDQPESFESICRGISASCSSSKKGSWWSKSLSILGLSQRRSKDEDGSRRGNLADRSMSETWRGQANGELGGFDRNPSHGNNTVNSRSSFSYNPFGIGRKDIESMEGLKRNQSARHSLSSVDVKVSHLNTAAAHHRRKGSWGSKFGKSGSMSLETSVNSTLQFFRS